MNLLLFCRWRYLDKPVTKALYQFLDVDGASATCIPYTPDHMSAPQRKIATSAIASPMRDLFTAVDGGGVHFASPLNYSV